MHTVMPSNSTGHVGKLRRNFTEQNHIRAVVESNCVHLLKYSFEVLVFRFTFTVTTAVWRQILYFFLNSMHLSALVACYFSNSDS